MLLWAWRGTRQIRFPFCSCGIPILIGEAGSKQGENEVMRWKRQGVAGGGTGREHGDGEEFSEEVMFEKRL